MRMTAVSLNPLLGSKAKAFEWSRSISLKAQYTAEADGRVRVRTYKVAIRYIILNFCGFHIACIISLPSPEQQLDVELRGIITEAVERALHCDSMAPKCVENVSGSCEV